VHDTLRACHDESCGGYVVTQCTTYKVLFNCYYWSTLHEDTKDYFNHCDQCQWMGRPTQSDDMPLHSQISLELLTNGALTL
jgi:hypothetical protein